MDIYIGSSSETCVGVGNLLIWPVESVKVDCDRDREEGSWRVEEIATGTVNYCTDLLKVRPDLPGALLEVTDPEMRYKSEY